MIPQLVAQGILWTAFLFQVTGQPDIGFVSQVERIGFLGAALIAVGILWRSNTQKDSQLIDSAKTTAQALLAAAEANRQMIESNKELREAISELRDGIGRLPCTDVHNGAKRG